MYQDKRLPLRIAWNFWGLYICGYGLVESILLPLPAHLLKGGDWQFLTNSSLLVTCLCMICMICIRIGKVFRIRFDKIEKYVENVENLCCNLEFIVTVTYWSIILFCPDMLNGKSFDVSWILDLKIHLFPYIFLLIDILLIRNNQELDLSCFAATFGLSVMFLGLYWALIEINTSVFNDDGFTKFPYPFLNDSDFLHRTGWLCIFIGLGLINHIILYYSMRVTAMTKLHLE
mmetsp:Transcript_2451/g.2846  ORF Transcript_2451/g.2846 Transcript_2451/m.2846 type:complete len:231 (+) Transcript_2451:4399-5091(+)